MVGRVSKFYYGWIITLVGLVIVTLVYGCKLCFGTLFGSLVEEFGWSRAMVTSIFSISILVQALLQPMGGALLDRFGPRKMLALGGILMGLSLVVFGMAHSLWSIYLSYGVLFSLATVVGGFVTNTTMVSYWFNKKRGIAIGIVGAGTSLGLFIFNPLLAYLIENYGWRLSMEFLGVLAAAAIVGLVFLLTKNRPEDVGQYIDGVNQEEERQDNNRNEIDSSGLKDQTQEQDWSFNQALKTREFWLLFLAYVGYLFAWYSITNHTVMAMCDMGLERMKAATIFGYTGLSGAIAGLVCAWIADYLRDRKYMVIIAYMLIGSGVLLLSRCAGHIGLLYFIVIIMGIGHGGGVLMSAVVADRFGVSAMGKIWGTITMAGLLGGAIGPVVVGYIFDVTKSYSMAWMIVTGIATVSLLCMACVRKKPGVIKLFPRRV